MIFSRGIDMANWLEIFFKNIFVWDFVFLVNDDRMLSWGHF